MSYIIYDHISPSGKHYIGQTCRGVKDRWGKNGSKYLRQNSKGNFVQPLFANAIIKYGWDNFEHKVLFTDLSKQEADMIEQDLIYYYKKEGRSYNIADGGAECFNADTMSVIQEAAMKKINQYTLSGKYLKTWKGIKPAARELGIHPTSIASVLYGRNPISDGYQWRYYTGDTQDISPAVVRYKQVCQYTADGIYVCTYINASEASKVVGVGYQNITKACKGERKTAGGYKWKFKEIE